MFRKLMFLPGFVAGVVCASLLLPAFSAQTKKEAPAQPSQAEIEEMMKKSAKYTQPSQYHKKLEQMIGTWDTELQINMGGQPSPVEKGRVVTSWLMKDRWLKTGATGTMLGRPMQSFTITGYDNFKKSYVMTSVQNMDTAMVRSEGDLDPSGKALIMYGTLDEYLTGEHDKMVKTIMRFVSKDKMIMEIHDLHIGETNTKVVEIVYNRAKSTAGKP